MDSAEKIREISHSLEERLPNVQTEEATKNALVMPFITALGYDVFNPAEVVPEFTSDVGTKKGEKVDYALKKDGEVIMLIECKHHKDSLSIEKSHQLYRYFHNTESRFAVITNGIIYRFYSDLEKPNIMDQRPFFEFDLRKFSEAHLAEIKKFAKPSFDLDKILTTANELKYVGAVRKLLEQEFETPSDAFVRFLGKQVYEGNMTKSVQEQFDSIVRKAVAQFINERVNSRLQSAIVQDTEPDETAVEDEDEGNNGIVTTEEELEGYHIVKAIGREAVDVSRIIDRDTKSYFGVLLDNNNRKPICRLHFNRSQKYLGIFGKDKKEERHPISSLDEIYSFSEEIKETIRSYEATQKIA